MFEEEKLRKETKMESTREYVKTLTTEQLIKELVQLSRQGLPTRTLQIYMAEIEARLER